ncbi:MULTISPECIES: translesion DNA synthesis-associated protein ImuA [unclassified Caballeronia]|uniref:translesion DNA synthesis-associated protein ImuA n=1 Tax=unclassified Caballeronia TaxID=2646786 RepID=UPI001588DA2A|nr:MULTISPECIES: translesion DNA synthesis-associated protein ImuA [unclassified Caballeronia]QSN60290.1 translesion DNA synthesis-associated protein ImuA [Caballeronia sp. M1242]
MGAALSLLDIGLTSRLQQQLWQGEQFTTSHSGVVPSGYRMLDLALPGAGWQPGTVTEVLIEESGVGEIRLLARTLRDLTTVQSRSVVFIAPPWMPNHAAFRAMNIAPNKLVWVKAPDDQVLWAAEQSLKQEGIGAVLIWLPKARPEALRRLQVAAQESQSLAFLFRPLNAAKQSSAAPLRMVCKPMLPAAAPTMNRREWMQVVMLEISIIKRRGPLLEKPLHLRLPLQLPALPEHLRRASQQRKAREVKHVVDSGDIAAFIARSSQAAIDAMRIGRFDFAWSEADAE